MNFYYHPILGLQYLFVPKTKEAQKKDFDIPKSKFFKNRITNKYF